MGNRTWQEIQLQLEACPNLWKCLKQILQIFGLIFNTEECKILRPIAIANLAFSTINTILTFTFSSKLSGKYSVGAMIFLTTNKGKKHTGIKGGHSISHTTSPKLSSPPSPDFKWTVPKMFLRYFFTIVPWAFILWLPSSFLQQFFNTLITSSNCRNFC